MRRAETSQEAGRRRVGGENGEIRQSWNYLHVESHLILDDKFPCDVLTRLCSIVPLLAVDLDVVHTFPLVNDEDLIGVSEP